MDKEEYREIFAILARVMRGILGVLNSASSSEDVEENKKLIVTNLEKLEGWSNIFIKHLAKHLRYLYDMDAPFDIMFDGDIPYSAFVDAILELFDDIDRELYGETVKKIIEEQTPREEIRKDIPVSYTHLTLPTKA